MVHDFQDQSLQSTRAGLLGICRLPLAPGFCFILHGGIYRLALHVPTKHASASGKVTPSYHLQGLFEACGVVVIGIQAQQLDAETLGDFWC
jgi:hypothetical protein